MSAAMRSTSRDDAGRMTGSGMTSWGLTTALDNLAVDVLAIANLEYSHVAALVIHEIYDPIIPLTDPQAV